MKRWNAVILAAGAMSVIAGPDLLDQIESPVSSVTADGAYDTDVVMMKFRAVTPTLT